MGMNEPQIDGQQPAQPSGPMSATVRRLGSGLPPATRTWYYGFTYVDQWRVYGTIQENGNSGAWCT
jgi:hypothetical protein